MSFPRSTRASRVETSTHADADIEDIISQSVENWGETQAAVYYEAISTAIRRLGAYHDIGRLRNDLFPGCRSFPVEQHVLYYRIHRHVVIVLRILHRRMNPRGLVREDV
jgi:toxin ParE1/3/4